jgi:hypothetical protein
MRLYVFGRIISRLLAPATRRGRGTFASSHFLTDHLAEPVDAEHIYLEVLKEPRCRNDHFCSY